MRHVQIFWLTKSSAQSCCSLVSPMKFDIISEVTIQYPALRDSQIAASGRTSNTVDDTSEQQDWVELPTNQRDGCPTVNVYKSVMVSSVTSSVATGTGRHWDDCYSCSQNICVLRRGHHSSTTQKIKLLKLTLTMKVLMLWKVSICVQ